jgi:lipopolysaccharide transport system permease protein
MNTETTPTDDSTFDRWIVAGESAKNYWRDLWQYRELFVILAWRDVAVRYKQTVAGTAWALMQPLLSMVIMTVIFGRVAGLPSIGETPYAIMVFAALLPWQFFSSALANAGQSLVANRDMIAKIYFPRMIVPAGTVIVSLVDFLVSLVILCGLFVVYQYLPGPELLAIPVFLLLAAMVSLGAGFTLTALTVQYRDFRILVPFIVQFGLFLSPVAFSAEVVEEKIGAGWFAFYALNPMVVVIEGFRWAVLGGGVDLLRWPMAVSLVSGLALFIFGVWYFRKTERGFADVI